MEWGTRASEVGFFCFLALGDTKQKKPTPLDRGPLLHVNRPLVELNLALNNWALILYNIIRHFYPFCDVISFI